MGVLKNSLYLCNGFCKYNDQWAGISHQSYFTPANQILKSFLNTLYVAYPWLMLTSRQMRCLWVLILTWAGPAGFVYSKSNGGGFVDAKPGLHHWTNAHWCEWQHLFIRGTLNFQDLAGCTSDLFTNAKEHACGMWNKLTPLSWSTVKGKKELHKITEEVCGKDTHETKANLTGIFYHNHLSWRPRQR